MTARKAGSAAAKPAAPPSKRTERGGKAAAKSAAPTRSKAAKAPATGKAPSAGKGPTQRTGSAQPGTRAARPAAAPAPAAASRKKPSADGVRPATARTSTGSAALAPASAEVEAWLARFPPPLRQQVDAIRAVFHALSSHVVEEIKWNTPSFRASDDFATLHLRDPTKPMVVFHTGVKAKGLVLRGRIDEPPGRIDWRAPDRCLFKLGPAADRAESLPALRRFAIDWMARM